MGGPVRGPLSLFTAPRGDRDGRSGQRDGQECLQKRRKEIFTAAEH